jgi:hypothetical protein
VLAEAVFVRAFSFGKRRGIVTKARLIETLGARSRRESKKRLQENHDQISEI